MARLSALLFDLDGTLVDTRADLAASLNRTLLRHGRPEKSLEEIVSFIGQGARTLLSRAFGEADGDRALIDGALKFFLADYLEHCTDNAALYPDVAETLTRLNGASLAVVTNKPQAPSLKILEALGIAPLFKAVVGGDQVKNRKPEPDHLWEALKRLDADPSAALIIGDSGIDIAAGKAAGARTCAVTYGYRPIEELKKAAPDFLISRFSELRRIIP